MSNGLKGNADIYVSYVHIGMNVMTIYRKDKKGEGMKNEKKKLEYNLQFFSEEGKPEEGEQNSEGTGENTQTTEQIDPNAFAEIISEKDKKIEQLESKVAELNKVNASLLLKVSAKSEPEMSTEDKIYGFMNPRKE